MMWDFKARFVGMEPTRPEVPGGLLPDSTLRSAESRPRRQLARYRTGGTLHPQQDLPAVHIPEPTRPRPLSQEPQPHYTPQGAYPHLINPSPQEAGREMLTQPSQTYRGFQPIPRNDKPTTSALRRSTRREPPRRDFRADLSDCYPRAERAAAGTLQYRSPNWTETRGLPEARQQCRPPPPYPGRRPTERLQDGRYRPYHAPPPHYQQHRLSEAVPYYENQPVRYQDNSLDSGGTIDVQNPNSYPNQEPQLVPFTQRPFITPDLPYPMPLQCFIQPQRPEERPYPGQFLLCLGNSEESPQRPVVFRRYIAEGYYPVVYVNSRETSSQGIKPEQLQPPSTMNSEPQVLGPYDVEDVSPPTQDPEEPNDPQPAIPETNTDENNEFSPSSPDNPLVIDLEE